MTYCIILIPGARKNHGRSFSDFGKISTNLLISLVGCERFELSINELKVRVVEFMCLILLTFLPQMPLQFAQKCTAVHYSWPQNGHSDYLGFLWYNSGYLALA